MALRNGRVHCYGLLEKNSNDNTVQQMFKQKTKCDRPQNGKCADNRRDYIKHPPSSALAFLNVGPKHECELSNQHFGSARTTLTMGSELHKVGHLLSALHLWSLHAMWHRMDAH